MDGSALRVALSNIHRKVSSLPYLPDGNLVATMLAESIKMDVTPLKIGKLEQVFRVTSKKLAWIAEVRRVRMAGEFAIETVISPWVKTSSTSRSS